MSPLKARHLLAHTSTRPDQADAAVTQLPPRVPAAASTLGALIAQRRSSRRFADAPLTLEAISQLLGAAQGITAADGGRAAPSAGALYPLEILLAAGRVDGIGAGLYRYQPQRHVLARLADGDHRKALAVAAWGQDFIAKAAAIVVISAIYERTTRKYGDRGFRYVHMEAGHVAQNLCLMVTELQLKTVVVGAFNDADVRQVLQLGDHEAPLTLMPVGTG